MREAVGVVTACASAPYFQGVSSTMTANGAVRKKKSQTDVVATTLTPAMFNPAQTVTTANPASTPRCPTENQGKRRER